MSLRPDRFVFVEGGGSQVRESMEREREEGRTEREGNEGEVGESME